MTNEEKTISSSSIVNVPSYWREYPERDVEYVRWYPSAVGPLSESDIWTKEPFVFYIHIPFCNNVCSSCLYNKFNTQGDLVSKYLVALKKEIVNYASRPYLKDGECISGYFGGGTPTALSTPQLEDLLTVVFQQFNMRKDASFTIETTPNEVDGEKAAMLLEHGVDRISMGVQSFDDTLLKNIGRTHTAEKARKKLAELRKAGFKHVCIDLMCGLPGQTLKQWEDTIDEFLSLKLESLSIYTYLVIPDSKLYSEIQRGSMPPPPSAEVLNEMYNIGVKKILRGGYFAVTANDFGRDPFGKGLEKWGPEVQVYNLGEEGLNAMVASTFPPTAHLNHTWYECGDLLALGSGAYGYIKDHMYLNEPNIHEYITRLESGKLPIVSGSYVSPEEKMARSMVLGTKFLKLLRKDFEKQHGVDMMQIFGEQIKTLEQRGLIEMSEDALQVTFPKGWYYMDNISKAFYTPFNYRLPQPSPMNTNILKYLKRK